MISSGSEAMHAYDLQRHSKIFEKCKFTNGSTPDSEGARTGDLAGLPTAEPLWPVRSIYR